MGRKEQEKEGGGGEEELEDLVLRLYEAIRIKRDDPQSEHGDEHNRRRIHLDH